MNKKIIDWWIGGAVDNNLLDSIIAYWKFDANANDSVGSLNGTVSGATLAAGVISNGYSFANTTDRITVTDSSLLTFGNGTTDSPFSVSLWVKPTNFSALKYLFAKRASGTPTEYQAFISATTGQVNLSLLNSGATASIAIRSGLTLTSGAWNHVVFTYSGNSNYSGLKVYINGILSTGDTDAGGGSYSAMSNTATDFTFATFATATSNTLVGMLDEIGIWGKVLSQTDVTRLYNSGAGLAYSSFT